MVAPAAFDGHGATLTFSGVDHNLIDISGPGMSRAEIETTHMGTTGAKTYIPAELIEAGEITATFEANLPAAALIDGAAGSLVIVWGDSGGTTWTWANAFVKGEAISGAKTGERPTVTVTFKLSSKPTIS